MIKHYTESEIASMKRPALQYLCKEIHRTTGEKLVDCRAPTEVLAAQVHVYFGAGHKLSSPRKSSGGGRKKGSKNKQGYTFKSPSKQAKHSAKMHAKAELARRVAVTPSKKSDVDYMTYRELQARCRGLKHAGHDVSCGGKDVVLRREMAGYSGYNVASRSPKKKSSGGKRRTGGVRARKSDIRL